MQHKIMSFYSFALLFLLLANFCFAQSDKTDVVYLKNGSIIKGEIVEFYPDSLVKIETWDGSLFVYKIEEILKLAKEDKRKEVNGEIYNNKTNYSGNISPLKFGIKGGLNISSWKVGGEGSSEEFKNRNDFAAGVFLTQYAPFSVRFEILYNRKGAKETYTDPYYGTDSEVEYKIECLSLIPFFILGTDDPDINIFFEFGPEVAFLLSKKGKVEMYGETIEDDLTDMVSTELCFDFGLGFFIDNTLLIDARYAVGIIDLINDADADYQVEAYSRNIQIMLGVVF